MDLDTDRLERERSFHDERFEDDSAREAVGMFYSAVPGAEEEYIEKVRQYASGRALEYGCGAKALTFDLPNTVDLHGIDISPVAIEIAIEVAKEKGVEATFVEMDAENLTFEEASFDLVFGSGILHHLDIDSAAAQLAKVIRPGGHAVFVEPMGYNPLINWYRNRTPEMRTDDEHPFVNRDFEVLARRAKTMDVSFHGLSALAAAPIISSRPGRLLNSALTSLDTKILSVPRIQQLAWMAVIDLTY